MRRLLLAVLACSALSPATARAQEPPPNVVVIVMDDMRWDELDRMPTVQRELAGRGTTFTDAFVVNAICCPSRASILTGDYSHTTGVYRQEPSFGRWDSFEDSSTIATWLDGAGYDTALVGKYLDGYQHGALTGYVPAGWDRWVAFVRSDYYDYSLTIDGEVVSHGDDPSDYATDVLATQAVSFIESAEDPFFLYFAPPAPHEPATPPPGPAAITFDHAIEEPRPPSFNELDVGDKPAYIRARSILDRDRVAQLDRFAEDRRLALQGADAAIGRLLGSLESKGVLDDTLIVFTSDNGLLLGEHRWTKKEVPYEEAIRVPLVVRYDRFGLDPRLDANLVGNIDIAPTIAELSGAPAPPTDGRSLAPLLRGAPVGWRSDLLVEHLEGGNPVPTYCAVRSEHLKYVRYATGEEELYDLASDGYELTNLVGSPVYAAELDAMRARLEELCSPPPPGLYAPRTFALTWWALGALVLLFTAEALRRQRSSSSR